MRVFYDFNIACFNNKTVLYKYNALISHYNRLRVLVVDVMDERLDVSWRVREVRDGRVSVETAGMHLITFPHGQLGERRKVVLQYCSLYLLHATTYVQHIEHPIQATTYVQHIEHLMELFRNGRVL